jgi:hypothetical protein
MANTNRNRRNQPPTGEGKRQPRVGGEAAKRMKRSEGPQAQRHHPELNLGEAEGPGGSPPNVRRTKAGR